MTDRDPRRTSPSAQERLTVRADADAAMGVGHVMRMIALGQAWRARGGEVVFVSRVADALADRIRKEGFLIERPGADSGCDPEAVCAAAPEGGWVAVDGYHFSPSCVESIRRAGRKALVLDDVNDRGPYRADLLLNQNVGAETAYRYETNPGCAQLMGSSYALLRKEFVEARERESSGRDALRRILVLFGGGDRDNLSGSVLRAAEESGLPQPHVKVVVGPVCPHADALKALAAKLPFRVDIVENPDDMPGLMRWADLAVAAAGSTCWELCLLGVPMALAVVADNQAGIGDRLAEAGAARLLDRSDIVRSAAGVLRDLAGGERVLESMGAEARRLVDGRGAMRVAEAMRPTRLTLRQPGDRDLDQGRLWGVDSLGRSGRPHAGPDSMLLVGENQWGTPVGFIRFDRRDGEAGVAVCLAPDFRGIGLGRLLITEGTARCREAWGLPVAARVERDDPVSAQTFRLAGYAPSGKDRGQETGASRWVFGGEA